MVLLKRINDQLQLQILCDALMDRGIVYQVDNQGINALMPVPGLFDARLMVAEADLVEARQVLVDIEKLGSA
jgi:hypothetical protein